MIDFSQYSDEQIVEFVDEHFDLFSADNNPDFPQNILRMLKGDLFHIAKRTEGFAVVAKGRNELFGGDEKNAELMFLYVQPEYQGKGIGADLIEEAKACLPEDRILEIKCEGPERRSYFQSKGFSVVQHFDEYDQYNLELRPPLK